jgi:xylan 1,4-beta-xylosidase
MTAKKHPIEFWCNPDGTTVPLPHNWEHTIGSDHAAMALRAEYQEQLKRCHEELGIGHVRFHGLLSDDMGTLVEHGGKRISSFHNAHAIWDFLLDNGMKPFVELSFMPEAIASGHATVFHYRGNVTPPKRYADWANLIDALVRSAVDRYGISEVVTWPFEVWNEPNIRGFWRGTRDQYWRLYTTTALTLKAIHPDMSVGGPATAQNAWIGEFLEFSERRDVPVDFVSTHHYPTDRTVHISSDPAIQLAHAQRGILREEAQDARCRARGKPLYYTEWNTSADSGDPLHDEPYAATFIVQTLLNGHGLADVYSFWTFSDLFEESHFSSIPFHGGFGLLTIHGVAKPSYRAFELLHTVGTELVTPIDGMHPAVDAWVVRGNRGKDVAVIITNHALPEHPIVRECVLVHLDTPRRPRAATLARIDGNHANAKRRWREMGTPTYPSRAQVDELHAASVVARLPYEPMCDEHGVHVQVDVPPHGVAMVYLTFDGAIDGVAAAAGNAV